MIHKLSNEEAQYIRNLLQVQQEIVNRIQTVLDMVLIGAKLPRQPNGGWKFDAARMELEAHDPTWPTSTKVQPMGEVASKPNQSKIVPITPTQA